MKHANIELLKKVTAGITAIAITVFCISCNTRENAKQVFFKNNVPSPQDWLLLFEMMKEPIQLHPDNPGSILTL